MVIQTQIYKCMPYMLIIFVVQSFPSKVATAKGYGVSVHIVRKCIKSGKYYKVNIIYVFLQNISIILRLIFWAGSLNH
jgi:hypothetical protein